MEKVTVIVPVFNQKELTEQCVSSVLAAKVEVPYRVLLIDDSSTETGLTEMLAGFATDPRVEVLRNSGNLGFTKTANIGLNAAKDAHPLLLNSDTIVYDHWLDVMLEALHSAPNIASVSPLTNQNGSHISCYPLARWADHPPAELVDRDLAEIAFSTSRSVTVKVHTNVGFCILINKLCVEEVGLLDDFHFPRGYGEETDFCYRARYLGWDHLVAGGAFVTHLHGKSFGKEKNLLRDAMIPKFRRLHPTQPELDRIFRDRDPVHTARRSLDTGRLKSLSSGHSSIVATKDPQSTDIAGYPYLFVQGIQSNIVSFRMPGSKVGFPNLEPYVLPNDMVRLVLDLEKAGINKIEFINSGDLLGHCGEYLDILNSLGGADMHVENDSILFTSKILQDAPE